MRESQFRKSSPAYVFLLHLMDLPEFMDRALCTQEPGDKLDFLSPDDAQRALYVCSACPVREACARYTHSFDRPPLIGVWGGEEYPR